MDNRQITVSTRDVGDASLPYWILAVLAMATLSIFYKLGAAPIHVWDESRVAVNALEMSQQGFSLITTFDGAPDHWNTKPPLLVWLMAASISFFGPNELAVRLPSALAGLATVVCVYLFTLRRLGTHLIALFAAALLLATPGYLHDHAVRAGDYDALLTLWTTAFVFAAYAYLHPLTRARGVYLSICAVLVALAFMTKAVQGLILLVGIALYAVLSERRREILRERPLWLHGIALCLFMCSWYVLRDYVDPGYFAAANAYDLLGRFDSVIEGHKAGPLFYLLLVVEFPFLIPGLVASAWLGWSGQGESRQLGRFLFVNIAAYLFIISAAQTKLVWYAVPLAPLCAVALAALADELRVRYDLTGRFTSARSPWVVTVGLALMISVSVINAWRSDRRIVNLQAALPHQYSLFMRSATLMNSGISDIVVAHPGFLPPPHWWPGPAQFYVEALAVRGLRASLLHGTTVNWPDTARWVLSCGDITAHLQSAGRVARVPVVGDANCGVYDRLK